MTDYPLPLPDPPEEPKQGSTDPLDPLNEELDEVALTGLDIADIFRGVSCPRCQVDKGVHEYYAVGRKWYSLCDLLTYTEEKEKENTMSKNNAQMVDKATQEQMNGIKIVDVASVRLKPRYVKAANPKWVKVRELFASLKPGRGITLPTPEGKQVNTYERTVRSALSDLKGKTIQKTEDGHLFLSKKS
jgi:hypothetical protein